MSDVTPQPNESYAVIRMKDGTEIRCQLTAFPLSPGSQAMVEQRWVFATNDGRQHIGPTSTAVASREELERLVDAWWSARQANQQQGRSRERES